IREAIVEADLAVNPLGTGVACLRREVAGARRALVIVGEHHATATGRDDLVAVERQTPGGAAGADPPALVQSPERLGGVLDERHRPAADDRLEGVEVDRMTTEMEGQQRRNAPTGGASD